MEISDLIDAGFTEIPGKWIEDNPIYYRTEGERTMIYGITDGKNVVKLYDGKTKYIKDKLEEWRKKEDG